MVENNNKSEGKKLIRVKISGHKSKNKEKDIVVDHVQMVTDREDVFLLIIAENGSLTTAKLSSLKVNEG